MKTIKNSHLLVLLLFLFSSCNSIEEQKNETSKNNSDEVLVLQSEQLKKLHLKIGKTQLKKLSSSFRVNGIIEVPPQNMISISIPLGGFLKSTKMLPGTHVNKGQELAVVEAEQYIQIQRDYLSVKAQIKYFETEYRRQQELFSQKAASEKALLQAEADYNRNLIDLKSLEQKLSYIGLQASRLNENTISKSISILSPIDGYVTSVNSNIGKFLSETNVLLELVNPQDIHLSLTIFEKDLKSIYVGQKVKAFTNNNSKKIYNCEVILIGQQISSDQSVEVHCHFDGYDKALFPGTYMNAEIQLQNDTSLIVPEDAVVRYENKTYVFVPISENNFKLTEVVTGESSSGEVVILSNSIRGKNIVLSDAYTLLMALKNREE